PGDPCGVVRRGFVACWLRRQGGPLGIPRNPALDDVDRRIPADAEVALALGLSVGGAALPAMGEPLVLLDDLPVPGCGSERSGCVYPQHPRACVDRVRYR